MIARVVLVASLSAAIAVPAFAQGGAAPASPPPGPNVGDMAPDFTGVAADKSGTLKAPVHLADLKGKTVILAFFPRARTGGCTQQMTSYRDQYDSLFNAGKDVVLLGISNDADTTLTNWANEAKFPFKFVSDKDGKIGMTYGAMTEARHTQESRFLYVIDPTGKITYTAKQFQPFQPSAYTDLNAAIKKARGLQ